MGGDLCQIIYTMHNISNMSIAHLNSSCQHACTICQHACTICHLVSTLIYHHTCTSYITMHFQHANMHAQYIIVQTQYTNMHAQNATGMYTHANMHPQYISTCDMEYNMLLCRYSMHARSACALQPPGTTKDQSS